MLLCAHMAIMTCCGRMLTCSTTVTVPGAMATTDATVPSVFSDPSSMICCRMFTAAGSSPSAVVADTTPM